MKENRINTRLPEVLARHVNEMCGDDGYYDNASEFVRDLVRQHYEKIEHEKTLRLKSKLAPRINRPLSEFIEVDPEKSIQEFEQRYLAEKKAKK